MLLLSLVHAQEKKQVATTEKSPPRYHNVTVNGITMQGVSFDIRTHQLQVLDQPNGPGTLWATCKEAATSVQAIAAVNASFFTPEGKPLGVCIANGVRSGATHQSSLGSGVWFEADGKSGIVRREKSNFRATNLIQAGPFLAEKSATINGLDDKRQSARTFIAWDGGNQWCIVRTSPCSLHALSQLIAGKSHLGFPMAHALNFDGGRSAELYVAGELAGADLTVRPFFNLPVRNFVVLKKR